LIKLCLCSVTQEFSFDYLPTDDGIAHGDGGDKVWMGW